MSWHTVLTFSRIFFSYVVNKKKSYFTCLSLRKGYFFLYDLFEFLLTTRAQVLIYLMYISNTNLMFSFIRHNIIIQHGSIITRVKNYFIVSKKNKLNLMASFILTLPRKSLQTIKKRKMSIHYNRTIQFIIMVSLLFFTFLFSFL